MGKHRYAVVGSGRWGSTILSILQGMGRDVKMIAGTRRVPEEANGRYAERIRGIFNEVDAEISWVCVPPGRDAFEIVRTVVERGMHVVIEKPWTHDAEQTTLLTEIQARHRSSIGVHFQYCFLEKLGELRYIVDRGEGWRLSGRFMISRENRLRVPASQNLGCHLIAIQRLFFPAIEIDRLDVGYSGIDSRFLSFTTSDGGCEGAAALDFTRNTEPLIQRFVEAFEMALKTGERFPFDLVFASQVREAVSASEARGILIDLTDHPQPPSRKFVGWGDEGTPTRPVEHRPTGTSDD